MDAIILKKRFLDLLPPPLPNDWEAEENLAHLVKLPEQRQNLILQHVQAIWPVSNSLCYSYLAFAERAVACIDDEQIGDWVALILDTYEKDGLKEAQAFMMDVEGKFLCRLRGENGVELNDAALKLLPYAKGIAKKPIELKEGPDLYTDTVQIFLPKKITFFQEEAENFLLYKLMITAQLCLVGENTCGLELQRSSPIIRGLADRYSPGRLSDLIVLEDFWDIFPESRLAEDIYTLIESSRIDKLMNSQFRGLMDDVSGLTKKLAEKRNNIHSSHKSRLIEKLTLFLLSGQDDSGEHLEDDTFRSLLSVFNEPSSSAYHSAEKTVYIYALLDDIPEPYKPVTPLPYIGRLQPALARQVKLAERAENRQKFIETFSAIIAEDTHTQEGDNSADHESEGSARRLNSDAAIALLFAPDKEIDNEELSPQRKPEENRQSLVVLGTDIEIPESLKDLAADIIRDLGHIPDEYISAAHGFSGNGHPSSIASSDAEGASLKGAITYDEWDYRRAGFRKDWCLLNEKTVHSVKGSFVSNTLEKYRGLLIKLKIQFEMLRSAERFVRRQREGDDIDLDAVIESISDIKAGRPESEKLFIKLRHDTRDIGVMFLIDMSSSTEGWVGEALKESLILMGESLEVLGDRYAIAGFSGMRRSRSEFFHIKDFDEPYNEEIRGRIAAISPQEYTRMGPPVRHATNLLQKVDAKVRLLIVLSDGKPEDYDDYKGEYAIEDTRHALIEAKAAGIHPFCITIDKQAHDYNAHMYGEVNYIFLDKVKDLPVRMPAIYRNLTT